MSGWRDPPPNYRFQNDEASSTYTNNNNNTTAYDLSGRIMLTAIVVLITVIIVVAALHIYARWYLLRARRRRRRTRLHTHLVFYVDSGLAPPPGLDSAVLKSLPVFVFSGEDSGQGSPRRKNMDCAVCLSEFQENEEGRRLPKCDHSFHIECIDMWFQSHDTCPLCRTTVEMYEPEQVEVAVVDRPVMAGDPPRTEETGASTLWGMRRKVKEKIAIEVPKRNVSLGRTEMEFMYTVRSPVTGKLSLRRILNREGGGRATPSPSSAAGCSTAAMGGWDVEKGKEEFSPAPPLRAETPKLEV